MSNDDSLLRAAKALRNAEHTAPARAKGTRARILMSVNSNQQRRRRRWVTGIPLGFLVLGGSAWAQNSGKLAQWVEALEEVSVQLMPSSRLNPLARSGKHAAKLAAPTRAEAALPETVAKSDDSSPELSRDGTAAITTRDSVQNAAPTLSTAALRDGVQPDEVNTHHAQAAAHLALAVHRRTPLEENRVQADEAAVAKAPAATSLAASNVQQKGTAPAAVSSLGVLPPVAVSNSKPSVTESDPELALFRVAHDLHFKRSAAPESIAAHRAYLARFPRGRFVPEALYNIAVDQLRSGDGASARRQLEAFASGKYGGYRQREARELLAAMDRAAHGD